METFTFSKLVPLQRFAAALVMIMIFATSSYAQIAGITGTTPATRCGEGTLTLSATADAGTITWYDVPFYGEPIGTGSSFTTPSIFVTTTYYVDALDGGSCSLNPNQARIPVIATISANPAQAVIFYASSAFCGNVMTEQAITRSGTAGGTYTSTPAGLTLDEATGAIIPGSSNSGTYTVTYTVTPAQGCTENPANTTITITTAPVQPEISYTSSTFCTADGTKEVTQTGASGGIYSATPSGLSINSITGLITLASSNTGTYTINYVVPGSGGCGPQTATATVGILQQPTADISYNSPFCKNPESQAVSLTGTGLFTGGVYSSTDGLIINPTTGAIDPSSSTAGTYIVNYALAAVSPCGLVAATTSVTIHDLPTATLSGDASICSGGSADLSIELTGVQPWSFTYTNGNTPITITGQETTPYTISVSPSTSTAYSLVSVSDARCTGTTFGSANIIVTSPLLATFEYSNSPYCSDGSNPLPNMLGVGSTGVFSSTLGLVFVNAATGEINLSTSAAGTYTVTNTIDANGGCPEATATSGVTITKLPDANFSFTTNAYCTNATNPVPTKNDATTTGVFTATDGLFLVSASTGEINLAACTPGNHTVTYIIGAESGCGQVSKSFGIEILAIPLAEAGFNRGICLGASTQIGATPVTGNSYSWTSIPAGFTSNLANPTVNPIVNTTYTLVESNGNCSNTNSVTIDIAPSPAPNPIIGPAIVCAGNTNMLYAPTTNNSNIGALYVWDYNGDGDTYSVNANGSANYNFNNFATSGTISMTETLYNCSTLNTYAVTVNPLPLASAGGSQIICADATATVSGASSANGTILWTHNGAGSLTAGATTLTPTYTAAVADGGNTVTLTMTVTTSYTSCAGTTATATYTVDVNALPAAPTAGDVTVNYDGLAHTGTATAPVGSSVVWYDAATNGSVTVAPAGTNVGSYSAWAESVVNATGCKSATRTLVTVTIDKARITELAITGITPPIEGATPVNAATNTVQYTGTVSWNGSPATFAPGTIYTATITIAPTANYTLTGVVANTFTVAGATSVTHSANSGTVTAEFPGTVPNAPEGSNTQYFCSPN